MKAVDALGKETDTEELVERLFNVKLTDFQRTAIRRIASTKKNVIVVAPTGSGKTLIGYSAILQSRGGYYLAPLIALMNEKYHELKAVAQKLGLKVVLTNRDYRIPTAYIRNADIKIMSPYKFLVYFETLKPGVLVIDEFHKIHNDPEFEAAVTLALHAGFRIIALSATIHDEDLEKLANWLDAEVVSSTKRPVELIYKPVVCKLGLTGHIEVEKTLAIKLDEHTKVPITGGKKYSTREEMAADIATRIYYFLKKPVIVWAPTRRKVERIARLIAANLPEDPNYIDLPSKMHTSNPSERLLKFTISRGVFFHHGGLSYTTRQLVEQEYRKRGGIVVTAYTLSHGVNLPGSFLVLSTLRNFKGEYMSVNEFHQITGRAGRRPCYDEYGIVIPILVGETDKEVFKIYMANRASKINFVLAKSGTIVRLLAKSYATTRSFDQGIIIVKKSISYQLATDKEKEVIRRKITEAARILRNYMDENGRIKGRGEYYAMLMGLHPDEYKAILDALNSESYRDAVSAMMLVLSSFYKISLNEKIENDIYRYGYLAVWFGCPESRDLADKIQTTLEAGVYWASRVYGWKSPEREKLSRLAKMFAYAGNPRVEELAKELRIDQLRRVIKAVPSIVTGEKIDDLPGMIATGIREIFLFNKRVYRNRVNKLVKLMFYAFTGREPTPGELSAILNRVYDELRGKKIKIV